VIWVHVADRVFPVVCRFAKSYFVTVSEAYEASELLGLLQSSTGPRSTPTQCQLYVHQEGAGNGKTYKATMLMNDSRFLSKSTFLYLTKNHSNKDIIREKFAEVYPNEGIQTLGKQYRLSLVNANHQPVQILMGTIDSFLFSLGQPPQSGGDYFTQIVESVVQDSISVTATGAMKWGVRLNQQTLVVVDEAQDLPEVYGQALCSIQRRTHIDVALVGDILQSVFHLDNVMWNLLQQPTPWVGGISAVYWRSDNWCRRFQHQSFVDLVNQVVPFARYSVRPVSGYGDPSIQMPFRRPSVSLEPAYEVFVLGKTYQDTTDHKQDLMVEAVMSRFSREVELHDWRPNQILVIFPHVKKNWLARRLLEAVQDFWTQRLGEGHHAHLHYSEEGQPINLKDSELATRMVSIHAAKGDGRDSVWVLQLSEEVLKLYSQGEIDLKYESLLHVALTRQKQQLVVGLDNSEDDVGRRLGQHCSKQAVTVLPRYVGPDLAEIAGRFLDGPMVHELADQKKAAFPVQHPPIPLVDWGHHQFRWRFLLYYWQAELSVATTGQEQDQWRTILRKLGRTPIAEPVEYPEYTTALKRISQVQAANQREGTSTPVGAIPMLRHPVTEFALLFVRNVQAKLALQCCPELCPLETVTLFHLISVVDEGFFHRGTSIVELYRMFQDYRKIHHFQHRVDPPCLCPQIPDSPADQDQLECLDRLHKTFESFRSLQAPLGQFQYKFNVVVKVSDLLPPVKLSSVAFNHSSVILFWLQPAVSSLNFSEIVRICMIYAFLLTLKQSPDGAFRYRGKRILMCVITLMHQSAPFFTDLTATKADALLALTHGVRGRWTVYHKKLFSYYQHVCSTAVDPVPVFGRALLSPEGFLVPFYIRGWIQDHLKNGTSEFNDEDDFMASLDGHATVYWDGVMGGQGSKLKRRTQTLQLNLGFKQTTPAE
jgi:hypothetical protein